MIAPIPLPDLAAAEFRRRQARAREVVRNRGMGVATAEAHLRPWLAIACLCGADLPELADLRRQLTRELQEIGLHPANRDTPAGRHGCAADISTGGGDSAAGGRHDSAARWLLAEEICPRARWVPLLAEARDLAFDRLHLDGSPAAVASAAALHRIAIALRHDVNGCHVPDYAPRAERKAA